MEVEVRRLKFYLVNTLLKYKTKDGYRGSIVQVREKVDITRLGKGGRGVREIR